MPEVDLGYALKLPPEQAIAYFKGKGYTFSGDWYDTWQEAHAKAFTVAGVMRTDVLEDVRGIVQKALDEGLSLGEFRKGMYSKLAAKGWGSDGVDLDTMELANPWRVKTIYQTNMQTAYMAGRYAEMMDNVDNRPYWEYVAVMDNHTRPAHAALNGKVFKSNDPFWDTHYPPLGYRCRCRVRALSGGDIKDRKLSVESSEGHISWQDKLVSKATGELRPVAAYTDPLTGQKILTDVGWSYNPGKAWAEPFTPRPYDPEEFVGGFKTVGTKPENLTPISELPAKPLTKDLILPPHQESGLQAEDYVKRFLSEFGATLEKSTIYRDVLNDPVVISSDLFRDRSTGTFKVLKADREIYLPMLADTIKDPVEVWLTWVDGGGKTRICKRYIGIYKGAQGKEGGFAVFDLIDDVWQGTTVFSPERLAYLDKQRTGTLLYYKK